MLSLSLCCNCDTSSLRDGEADCWPSPSPMRLLFKVWWQASGSGMSAAASGQAGFVLCSGAHEPSVQTPAGPDDRQSPTPQPECPFCFVAAQSAADIGLTAHGTPVPAYAGLPIAGSLHDPFAETVVVPVFRRHPRRPSRTAALLRLTLEPAPFRLELLLMRLRRTPCAFCRL